MSSILDYFPLPSPRKGQVEVLRAIEQAFRDGYKNILLEAPVGSGKSPIAIAVARYYGTSHILTPRKSLQDQYYEDFAADDLVLMKGRVAYPCTHISATNPQYKKVINVIKAGGIFPDIKKRGIGAAANCATGPCTVSSRVKCSTEEHPCPYKVATEVAQATSHIVHNLHSFIYQAYFAERFDQRDIIIIDEAHDMEGIVRGFSSKKVTIPRNIARESLPNPLPRYLSDWADWFEANFLESISTVTDMTGTSDRDRFETLMANLRYLSEHYADKYVFEFEPDPLSRKTYFKFTPDKVGGLSESLLLSFGKKRLLMSGTIYNKNVFCSSNGLNPEETCFIRIGSSFPKANRPIYLKPEYTLDLSHKMWDQNFGQMVDNIKKVFSVFDDCKGLIHTPSYNASAQLYMALRDTGRVIMHDKDDFSQKLTEFYEKGGSTVFLSPTCQQGVDFKQDRARFQIVLRVPYLNVSDAFTKYKVENDFAWYNYQALVTFGQQIGRVNRSEDDFGVTILMDSRFNGFISRNRKVLPKWLTDAIIYK